MGERQQFQPLTRADRISVIAYRAGIALSALIFSSAAFLLFSGKGFPAANIWPVAMLLGLYIAMGMSVFCIHLYVSRFHRALKRLYALSLPCLAAILLLSKGDLIRLFAEAPAWLLLFLPLAGCLCFVAAKEAFCFAMVEGYLIALLLPLCIVSVSAWGLGSAAASYGLLAIALLLDLFALRKVFMPLHYDIGDKSAYQ